MRTPKGITLVVFTGLFFSNVVGASAATKVIKPTAPDVSVISSIAGKGGKANLKISIVLPSNNSGSKILGSKIAAGGKSCTIKGTGTSCTIKSLKSGKEVNVTAQSKNKKGFGSKSSAVRYVVGAQTFNATVVTPANPNSSASPSASSPSSYSPAQSFNVTNVGSTWYRMSGTSGDNPNVNLIAGTTIAFQLSISGHPFRIRTSFNGSDYNLGLIHVASNGVESRGAAAQGKDSGTLYWQIPADLAGNYTYQCDYHPAQNGLIAVSAS